MLELAGLIAHWCEVASARVYIAEVLANANMEYQGSGLVLLTFRAMVRKSTLQRPRREIV